MKTIKVKRIQDIPRHFAGIAEYADGSKEWCVNGKTHRVDGPAWEGADGTKEWYLNGELVYKLEPLGEYIVIEDGLPCDIEWIVPITQRKVLIQKGLMYLPNLPGL